MINFSKKLLSLIFTIGTCIGLHAQELDLRDDFGRTELMNYVIWQEIEIAAKQQEVTCLFDTCYEYHPHYIGRIHNEPIYSSVLRRKDFCMDKDIQALEDCKKDLATCITKTVIGIDALAAAGAQLKAYDHTGNTVLNYCKTFELYEALLAHGVPFQYSVCAYFNPGLTTVGVCGVIALTLYIKSLCDAGYFSVDTCVALKNSISSGVTAGFNQCKNLLCTDAPATSQIVDCGIVQSCTNVAEIVEEMTAQQAFDIIEALGLSF